jgi:hypothetical protein
LFGVRLNRPADVGLAGQKSRRALLRAASWAEVLLVPQPHQAQEDRHRRIMGLGSEDCL